MFAFDIVPIFDPACRIVFDIFPDLPIIRFIADDVLVVGSLPQGRAGLSGGPAFHLRRDRTDRRGGYHPPVLIVMETEDQMNVVWHNDGVVDGDVGIDRRNIANGKSDDFPAAGKPQLGRAADSRPYGDVREDAPPVAGAYGDEIRAGGGIIVSLQSDSFPFRQIHGHASLSSVGAATCRP